MNCIIIVYSYHHNNTLKIANAFSRVLNCKVLSPDQAKAEDLQSYDVIGFGAGIDSGRHYKPLLDFVDLLPNIIGKSAFIFSTNAVQSEEKVDKDHSILRQMLQFKGYDIAGEFSCKGFNTNSFLKYLGGMNKGKPDGNDLRHAEEFAEKLLKSLIKNPNKNER